MIEIANIENSPVVEISVNGILTKEDIQEIDKFFENKVDEKETINIMFLMKNWEGLTLKGLIEDFKLVQHIKNIEKAAVVADSKFLEIDSKIEDLYPGIRIVYFEPDEKAAAKKWLVE